MHVIRLEGAWKVREVPAGSSVAAESGAGDWLPATVPGCVHTDLMAAGRIPDPFHRMNNNDVMWVHEKDWLFLRTVEVDKAVLAHDRVQLVCEGLDTFATIVLNGLEIAKTENALVAHTFEVKDALREGTNTLAIGFESSDRVCREREAKFGRLPGGARVYARKPQYATGWDWGPVLPNCGIVGSLFLRAFSAARIASVYAPVELRDNEGVVRLAVDIEEAVVEATGVEAAGVESLTLDVTLCFEGENVAAEEIHGVRGRGELALHVERPLLWWPAGMGDPDLYDLSVRLRRGGEELDRYECRIGFRTIELERKPDEAGESFMFKVNGRPIFCKGANWIPADSFPWRVTLETCRRLLETAVDQNMNMLRVWGGGIYEPDEFYELCDELGLLVWQDFMFACADYPDLDWFQELVRLEAESFVTRVRNHACPALYCGNNENQMGHQGWGWPEKFSAEKIYGEILPAVCKALDPTRPYWPGSPFGGPTPNSETHGDCHDWSVWHGGVDCRNYCKNRARFVSEFGFQGFPTMETIRAFSEPGDRSMDSDVMRWHQRCGNGNEKIREALKLFMPDPEDFERTVLFSQLVEAQALKTGIEHWRRLKWHTSGALFWQLNDCWPVISWAVVDYYLRPKAAYYFVRRSFAPVLVTVHVEGDEVVVTGINDTERVVSGTLDVELFDVLGEANLLHTDAVEIPEDGTAVLCTLPLSGFGVVDKSRHFVWVTFYSGIYDSNATCFFGEVRDLDLPAPEIQIEFETDGLESEVLVRLTAPVLVRGVWLSVPGRDVRFSDNAFDLIPYVSREIKVEVPLGITADELKAALRIQHCNRTNG